MKKVESFKKTVHEYRWYCNVCRQLLEKEKHTFQFQHKWIHLCEGCFEELKNLLFKGNSVIPTLKE